MPDPASLTTSAAPLTGLTGLFAIGGAAATNGPSDSAADGGFQAMLDLQSAPALPVPALVSPAATTTTSVTDTTALPDALVAQTVLPAALALGGNSILPQTGKILPPAPTVLPAAKDTSDNQPDASTAATTPPPTVDPALALMIAPLAQPVATTPATPAAASPASTQSATTATASATPVASATPQQATSAAPAAAPALALAAAPAVAAAAIAAAPVAALVIGANPVLAQATSAKITLTAPDANAPAQDSATAITLRPTQTAATPVPAANTSQDQTGSQTPDRGNDKPADHSAATADPRSATLPGVTDAATLAQSSAASVAAPVAVHDTAAQLSPQITATPAASPDMAALVDRLVEARQVARSGAGTQMVQATITHAEFGRVALNFRQDGEGLTVSMASGDPGFAPAAQAALAAQASQVNASASADGGQATGQNQSQNQGQNQTFQTQSGTSQSTGGQTGQNPQGQSARWVDPRDAAPRPARAQATAPAEDTATTLSRRSGILA